MTRERARLQPPAFRKDAELIIKANVETTQRGPAPGLQLACGVYLLGNRQGLRWLSDYFAWMSDRINEDAPFRRTDPDDHHHLDDAAPFNRKLSDGIRVMIGSFSGRHRRRVFQACGIRRDRGVPGDLLKTLRGALGYLRQGPGNCRSSHSRERVRMIRELRALIREAESIIVDLG